MCREEKISQMVMRDNVEEKISEDGDDMASAEREDLREDDALS